MLIQRNISWILVLRFAWAHLLVFIAWNSFIVFIYHMLEHQGKIISIPFAPISVIGIAVAFYVGFKNNASYDRFWEARKIWGGIVNYSRTWGNQVMSYVNCEHFADSEKAHLKEEQMALIYRHIAWLNALRHRLRQPSTFSPKKIRSVRSLLIADEEEAHFWEDNIKPFIPIKEYDALLDQKNAASQLIRAQGEHLKCLMHDEKLIEDFRHMDMMKTLEEFYNLQGKCERIKYTPFPRQYAFFSKVFTWVFIILLPFGMVGEFAAMDHSLIWITIPFSVLISWIFITMELVGDGSEDPFENFINDVPMTALCRTIEIDLREMLGETDLPEGIKPVNGVLW